MKDSGLSGGGIYADDLTWREQDILVLLAERLTNQEIAQQLHLAESTVKDYVGNILSKLYVKNRRRAVERAAELGLLDRCRKTATVPLTNLLSERTPFVGRKDELLEIKQQLGKTRLLSLVGPGGIGKTRLALKAAKGEVDDFEDGVFFVPLAPIHSAKDIIQAIAEGLKFPIATHEDPQLQLLRYLQKRELLLVMDNFEHLLNGVAIISEILQAAPEVKILVTSRERLNLQSETVLHVVGMTFPEQADSEEILTYDAITLFLQSASKVHPAFAPSPLELRKIVNICQLVGGMPLAIELAAAWLYILNVDEISKELEKDLDILSTEVRDAPARHRSIRAVFDHSWSLLDQAEQEIFMQLSVFRDGFTREAAQQVTGASLKQLAGLVDKSFLSHDPDSGRLEIHEFLRQYAQEHLEKTPEANLSAHEAHAAYYVEFMEQRWEHLKDNRQMQALAEIEADIENVREAWRCSLDQRNASRIWRFIYGLWYVYWIRMWNHAGMELFAEAVEVLQQDKKGKNTALRALAMAFQGHFMAWLGLYEQGYQLAKKGVEILEKHNYPEALVLAYVGLDLNAFMLTRYSEEIEIINKMLEIASKMNDKWLLALSLWAASLVSLITEDYSEAKRMAESNLTLNEEIGDVIGSTLPLFVLGHVSLVCDELEDARGYYLRSLNLSQKVGFHFSIQTVSKYLGKVDISLGKLVEAENYLLQSLRITKEIGFVRDIVNLFYEFARLRVAQDDPEGAVELLALVVQHPASQLHRMMEGSIRNSAKSLLAELEAELAPETYKVALERGREMDLDRVVDELITPTSNVPFDG